MAQKTKYITLTYPHLNMDKNADPRLPGTERQVYRVQKLKNSTEFTPGQQLLKKQVDELCAASDWDVTITGSL